ncbi:MAG TPA: enoyl-CoA hydratase, partial [Myxococcota bacterium]|nr:enoyl-CoA hydratase [Myxococcota bacterium]
EAARAIAARSPHAIRACKRLLRDAWEHDRAGALAFETELQIPLLGSPNQLEAVTAKLGRRPARFDDPS